MRIVVSAVLASALVLQAAWAEEGRIKYPADYKEKFTNYLSLDRTGNDDQIIRLYANDIALAGVKEGGEFPDGSVLIGEIYKAKKDDQGAVLESSLGRRVRDQLALLAVMEKQKGWGDDFEQAFKNGDWDFAAFKPDGTPADKDLNACRACHAPLTDLKHVFSYEHLK